MGARTRIRKAATTLWSSLMPGPVQTPQQRDMPQTTNRCMRNVYLSVQEIASVASFGKQGSANAPLVTVSGAGVAVPVRTASRDSRCSYLTMALLGPARKRGNCHPDSVRQAAAWAQAPDSACIRGGRAEPRGETV